MIRHPLFVFAAFPLFASSAWSQATTLRDAAANAGLNFGSATNSYQVSTSTSTYATVLKTQFNSVVCENEMKFDNTENPIGSFHYTAGDQVSAFAVANQMKMRGHNFIWHSQSTVAQGAVHDRTSGLTVMRTHIDSVGGHFKSKILEWDVLNEITADGSGGLRSDFWLTNIGSDYPDSALTIARRVIGTNGYLYYNDYGADGVNSKSTSIYNLVQKWMQNGVPIDGIGLQCHLSSGVNQSDISNNIKRFGQLGVRISLTEIDIKNGTTQDWTNLMNACLENFNCVTFNTWGLSDANSWLGSSCGCLLFDGQDQPKAAVQALITAMNNADPTIVAERKAFAARTPGSVATSIFTIRSPSQKTLRGQFGISPIPVFSIGNGGMVDALGRNALISPVHAVPLLP